MKVTDLGKRDLCREIAAAAGASPAGSYPRLVRNLQERFEASLSTDGLRTVLIPDDAHDVRPEVLAILLVLTNFDMDSRLVLSVILSGQTPLRALLRRNSLEDVARRLAGIAALSPLTRGALRDRLGVRNERLRTVLAALEGNGRIQRRNGGWSLRATPQGEHGDPTPELPFA